MDSIMSDLVPTLVAFVGAVLSLLIVSIKTRTTSLQNVLKKYTGDSVNQLNVTPEDFVIIYNDELIPFTSVKVVRKSDLTYDYFIASLEKHKKGDSKNETTNA